MLRRSVLCLAAVSAACGGKGSDITAPLSNAPPVAAFVSSCADLACNFRDSSSDPDGRIAAYRWAFGDRSADGTSGNAEHAYAAPGDYTVALRVTDDSGATDSTFRVVHTVLPPKVNVPPVAWFGASCADLTCTFTDSSSDADGTIVDRHWAFGDGEVADTSAPQHTYASAGAFLVQLVVTDDRGATAIAGRTVTATAPAPPPEPVPPPTGPAIVFSDSLLKFCFHPGSRNCVVLDEHVRFTSVGGPALRWTAVSDKPWIVVLPASGKTPTNVKVSIDFSKLPRGSGAPMATGAITVTSDRATNSPQTIPVEMLFYAAPL